MHTIGEKRIRMLNPRDIKKSQTHIRTDIDENELSLLRDSISASGILQPLLVRKISRGAYQLIAGERRLNAAIMAGLRRVPCVVHNANDSTALLYSLTENLQSQSINIFDEARALNCLIKRRGMSLSETATRLGISQTDLMGKLQMLRLEERLAHRVSSAGLGEEYVKALLRLPKECRAQALDKIIAEGLTVKQAEDYIFSILNPPLNVVETEAPKPQKSNTRKAAIGDTRLFSNSLLKLIETLKEGGVKVNFRKTESERQIEYKIKIKKEATDSEEFTQLKICQ